MTSLERAREFDAAIVKAARHIRVLEAVAWPVEAETRFLAAYRAGATELPVVRLDPVDTSESVGALEAIASECDRADLLQDFLFRTASSYATAGRMLAAIGTPEFTRCSARLYGYPQERYPNLQSTPLEGAESMLAVTDDLMHAAPPLAPDIEPQVLAERLRRAMADFFTHDEVEVVLDHTLAAKAVAGAKRVRLRATTRFTELDFHQLLQHEAFVHSATLLNGQKQPAIRSLGLSVPRTTRTQEGIAVFAEIVTGCIDLSRLRRIALRVTAMKKAIDGADFIEVFRHFLEAGQSEEESFRSTQRLFRGGDVRGKVVLTKDCVYLKGLLEVHAFLRIVVRDNRPEFLTRVFAGRLSLGDVVELAPLFDTGVLAPPLYVPPWAKDLRTLGALLAYSGFVSRFELNDITLENFVSFDERQARGEVG